MKIICWSDYACPYCYIATKQFENALAEMPETGKPAVEMRAWRLHPHAPERAGEDSATRIARKKGMTPEEAAARFSDIERFGADEGVLIRYGKTLPVNMMDAHRLTKLAQGKGDPGIAEKVTKGLFSAYFTENRDLSDREVLCGIGTAAGLDEEEIIKMLDSGMYRDDVLEDEREADRLGIDLVPHFYFYADDGRRAETVGIQSVDGLKEALEEAAGYESTD